MKHRLHRLSSIEIVIFQLVSAVVLFNGIFKILTIYYILHILYSILQFSFNMYILDIYIYIYIYIYIQTHIYIYTK